MRKSIYILMALVLAIGLTAIGQKSSALTQNAGTASGDIVSLGKALFFDTNLSKNGNQSCATCHDPAVGFTGPDSAVNAHGAVYPGSVPTLFGNRKPPAAAYAGDSPKLENVGGWRGGMFWDGRADGSSLLGDPLAEQAKGPFLNPLEQALASPEELCAKVSASTYAGLFEQVWGAGSLDCAKANLVYDQIGISIAAYERSPEVNPYNSKFDKFWDKAKGKRLDVTKITVSNWTKYRSLGLTDAELYGLALFNDPAGANCASCHSMKPGSKGYPLFTDYRYANLGVPKNLENPFYNNSTYNPDGEAWVDYGLGGYLKSAGKGPEVYESEMGKFKVPTLRNVDKRPSSSIVKAYGHNGYFKSLTDIVRFYASRGMMMGGGGMGGGGMGGGGMGGMCGGMMFPEPEINKNLATLNHFRCSDQSYIVTFLKTLSDGYFQR